MAYFDPALKFVCPVCEAPWGERCHVQVGVIRFESHYDRRSLADEEMFDSISADKAATFMSFHRLSAKWGIC